MNLSGSAVTQKKQHVIKHLFTSRVYVFCSGIIFRWEIECEAKDIPRGRPDF